MVFLNFSLTSSDLLLHLQILTFNENNMFANKPLKTDLRNSQGFLYTLYGITRNNIIVAAIEAFRKYLTN